MPLIEGIGDEVLQVFGLCFVILLFITAWKSTAIREMPQVRAVFIVDRRSPTVLETDANSETPPAPPDPGQSDSSASSPSENTDPSTEANGKTSENSKTERCSKPSTSTNEINAYRLSYFTNLQNQTPSTSASNSGEVPTDTAPSKPTETEEFEESENSISVKLKYLNDDHRIVRGNPKELLGNFKRRHFQLELDNNKNVLLIFQGRVLREEETLETIGMYDNCVVHCLVKNGTTPAAESGLVGSISNAPPDWNLESYLVIILASLFALSWSTFWAYPHLFGITSTILLACLTTIYVMAVASMYYPQLFQSI